VRACKVANRFRVGRKSVAVCSDKQNLLLLLQKWSVVCGLAANNRTAHRHLSTLRNFLWGFREKENWYYFRLDYDTVQFCIWLPVFRRDIRPLHSSQTTQVCGFFRDETTWYNGQVSDRRIGNGPHVDNTETLNYFLPTSCTKLSMRSPNKVPYQTERYMQSSSGIPVPKLNCEHKTTRTRNQSTHFTVTFRHSQAG